jgi:hypothetical protein
MPVGSKCLTRLKKKKYAKPKNMIAEIGNILRERRKFAMAASRFQPHCEQYGWLPANRAFEWQMGHSGAGIRNL